MSPESGPATFQEAVVVVSEVLSQKRFNTAASSPIKWEEQFKWYECLKTLSQFSVKSFSRFLVKFCTKNPQTRNDVFRKTTDFDCDSLHSEIAWFCLLWWSSYQIWVRCIASPYETNFPLVEFNEVQLRRDNSKIICVTLLVVSFLLLDFDPEELWPAYFVKDLIDVVILLWLLFGPIASYTFMVTIKEMWSKNIRKPLLSRRPSVFFFHLINLTSLRCVGFPTTAMHFVKLR